MLGFAFQRGDYALRGIGTWEEINLKKRNNCEKQGITFIEIPESWDKTKESLRNFITEKRREIFSEINL